MKTICKTTITFDKLKRLIFESILDEDKSRLIDKLELPDIEDEKEKQKARDEMKAFFKIYNTWENKLDWNKLKTITYADFEKIKDQASETKGAQKREISSDIKNIFKSVGKRKFEIIGENENWLFVAPLSYEAAVYCDSAENQGAGAKWCIGYEQDNSYWEEYVRGKNGQSKSIFIMAFNKNYKSLDQKELNNNLKYMIRYIPEDEYFEVWNQQDHEVGDEERFFNSYSEQDKVIINTLDAFNRMEQDERKALLPEINKKIEELKNMKVVSSIYFTKKEREVIETITIPDNIVEIEEGAFKNCENLKEVVIGNGVEKIGPYAFYMCHNLKSVKFGNSVKSIQKWAFYYCDAIEDIILPDSLISISDFAFCNCSGVVNLKFGNNLTLIGNNAFDGCDSLKEFVIPESVTHISERAFCCLELDKVVILSDRCIIEKNAFKHCDDLSELFFKNMSMEQIQSMSNYPWGLRKRQANSAIKSGKE